MTTLVTKDLIDNLITQSASADEAILDFGTIKVQAFRVLDTTGTFIRPITLPEVFDTDCIAAFAVQGGTNNNVTCGIDSKSATTVTVSTVNNNGSAVNSDWEVYVLAIGY